MLLLQNLTREYTNVMVERRDPRTDAYPLMTSPLPTLLLCLSYILIVKLLGPAVMASRPPFSLRKTLVFYNGLQVLFSAWLFYEYGRSGWFHGYSFTCQPVDYSNSPMALRMVHVCWWYYFSKFTEFFDTFFFILRKKNANISALHVIHHGVMPMSVWFGVKFTPGGHSTFFGLLNTFVHILMYFYYMLAAGGPRFAKFLWWKKYMTWVQMAQFIAIAVHSFQLLFTTCNYPLGFVWWIGCHGLLFLVLFSNYYLHEYVSRRKIRHALLREQKLLKNKTKEIDNGAFQSLRHRPVVLSNGEKSI